MGSGLIPGQGTNISQGSAKKQTSKKIQIWWDITPYSTRMAKIKYTEDTKYRPRGGRSETPTDYWWDAK